MKAAICYEFGKPLVIEEIEIDLPQAGEIKVKLAACAICHSDIHYMEGAWGGVLPAVYGHEADGVVEEVGPGVTLAKPGDHVVVALIRSCGRCYYCTQGHPPMCEGDFTLDDESRLHTKEGQSILQGLRTGACAEYVVVDESQVVPVPKEMPLDRASLLACSVITGLGAVTNTAQVPPGSSVVVIGTGGVGLNSIQGAALSGAQPIIAFDLVKSKLEAAKAFGATHVVNPTEENAPAIVRDEDEWPGRTEAIVPTIRRALGDDVALLVDANCCYTPKKAIEVGRMLEDHGICHFEEPCPYRDFEWGAEVTQALQSLDINVAGGEQDCNLSNWRRIVNMRAFDIVQPDICYVGGLTRALRVAAMAQEAGIPCVPHSANLSLVTVFSLHMMGAIENAGPYVEFSIEGLDYYPWQKGLFSPALEARDGKVQIPGGPGWGVEINAEWLAGAERQVSEVS